MLGGTGASQLPARERKRQVTHRYDLCVSELQALTSTAERPENAVEYIRNFVVEQIQNVSAQFKKEVAVA